MNLESIFTELEEDLAWRTDELRFLSNQLVRFASDEERNRFRRSLVLMLYAHFEGYCKFVFMAYINALNGEGLCCRDVNVALAASSLGELFDALRNPNRHSDAFVQRLPEDTKLHRFARAKEFVDRMQAFEDKQVAIPDTVIDTESNLRPVVLRKILYLLGFEHDSFVGIEGHINQLLNYRNRIAHGEAKEGLDEVIYDRLWQATHTILTTVRRFVMESLEQRQYMRRRAS